MSFITFVASATLLLVASHFIFPSYGVPRDVLATICSQTQNQETCEKILEGDPRTSSADLPLLSLISLELAMKQADHNLNTFTQFRDNTTNAAVEYSYNKCVGIYQDMQVKLKAAYQFSRQKQFKNITELGQLTTLAYNCENELPSDSLTAAITEDMLLTSQTAIYVNEYVSISSF